MSSAVAELEAGLQAMQALKPPGVSGSRITGITALCVNNVQSESVLIQKLFTHFKKTPGTHKLGVLYVVDSVTRKWMDQAKTQGQPISNAAQDGTFAAGVHRVTELMPTLMNDIITTAPEDQKEKIKKLVDIWEKGQTFPPSMLVSFREKLAAPRQSTVSSTTPPGSPPSDLMASLGPGSKPPAPPVMPNIMEALANIARQNTSTSQSNPSAGVVAPGPAFGTSGPPSSGVMPQYSGPASVAGQTVAAGMPYLPPSPSAAPPVNAPPSLPFAYPPQMPQQQQQQQQQQQVPPQATLPPGAGPTLASLAGLGGLAGLGALAGVNNAAPHGFPANPPASAAVDPKVQQQLALITTLAAQGIPLDKITTILAQVMAGGGNAPAGPPPQMPQPTLTGYSAPLPVAGSAPWEPPRHDESRDRPGGYNDGMRSPNNRSRGRSRSRSPRHWDARGSPRGRAGDRAFDGRDSPVHGRPDERERDRGRGRGADSYRQRSPAGRRGQSPQSREPFQQEKWIEYDANLPSGCIKVYSRTLFVGGVTCAESELRQIFSRFGQVQTCIVNKDKRHAFVKMYFRKDAEFAKDAMEDNRTQDFQLRTRWGVGFGPRDCSDYQTGISIIPIHKLTEADRKWMLTAPFGGSGGRPITSGLCVEEPDIEIGAGVSSKAISRRMQTDKGGNHGPKSSRRDEESGPGSAGGDGSVSGGGSGGPPGGGSNGGGSGGSGGRWKRGRDSNRGGGGDGRRDDRNDKNPGNEEPVVLEFPPGISMGPNGINFPPGFAFGASS